MSNAHTFHPDFLSFTDAELAAAAVDPCITDLVRGYAAADLAARQAALIGPADAAEYLRAHDMRETEQWSTMLYWRGIITQGEYFAAVGMMFQHEVDAKIAALRTAVAEWLLA